MQADTSAPHASPGLGQRGLVAMIRAYQVMFAPMYSGSCRFVPSCSSYAAEAVARFGAIRGGRLAIGRLMRCHPLGGHGLDPVPASAPSGLQPSRYALRWTRRRGQPQAAAPADCRHTSNL